MPRSVQGVPSYQVYGKEKDQAVFQFVDCVPLHIISRKNRWRIDPHFHDDMLQVFLLQEGGGRCFLDEEVVDVKAPALVIIPPTIVHSFAWIEDSVGWVLTVEHSYLEQLLLMADHMAEAFAHRQVIPCENRIGEFEELKTSLQSIATEVFEKAVGFRLAIQGAVAQILTIIGRLMLENTNSQTTHDHQYRLYFRAYHRLVRQTFLEKISVEEYAARLNISRMHLNRICRSISGKTALHIIHDYVIHEAKRALIYTSMNISEVTAMLNFEDPAYFSRFFKRHVGISPKAFRAQENLRKQQAQNA